MSWYSYKTERSFHCIYCVVISRKKSLLNGIPIPPEYSLRVLLFSKHLEESKERLASLLTELTSIRLRKLPTTPIVISITTRNTISCWWSKSDSSNEAEVLLVPLSSILLMNALIHCKCKEMFFLYINISCQYWSKVYKLVIYKPHRFSD